MKELPPLCHAVPPAGRVVVALFVLVPDAARRVAAARDDIAAALVAPGPDGVDTVWVESALRAGCTMETPDRTHSVHATAPATNAPRRSPAA